LTEKKSRRLHLAFFTETARNDWQHPKSNNCCHVSFDSLDLDSDDKEEWKASMKQKESKRVNVNVKNRSLPRIYCGFSGFRVM
jgi:hypothetical protein